LLTRVRHYRGLGTTLPRIKQLLAEFRFTSIGAALRADDRSASASAQEMA
jgi:hypothetical protein